MLWEMAMFNRWNIKLNVQWFPLLFQIAGGQRVDLHNCWRRICHSELYNEGEFNMTSVSQGDLTIEICIVLPLKDFEIGFIWHYSLWLWKDILPLKVGLILEFGPESWKGVCLDYSGWPSKFLKQGNVEIELPRREGHAYIYKCILHIVIYSLMCIYV